MSANASFLRTRLGRTGIDVCRLGLAASYRPGESAIRRAIGEGINYLFSYGFDTQMTGVIRTMTRAERERVVIATGGYNMVLWQSSLNKALEDALRRLNTDYIDVFHYLGILRPEHFPNRVREELHQLRSDPRVRAVAVSCHHRRFAGELAAANAVDAMMVRYNAAHTGAERDVFPHTEAHDTGVIAYTATYWSRLLRQPSGWEGPPASAGQCYRFALSHPRVHVVLSAPRSVEELTANLRELERGPLDPDEMNFLRRLGEYHYQRRGWFMGG